MRMSDWSSDVCSSTALPFIIGFGAPGGLQDREAGGNQIRAIDDFLAALVGGLLRTPGDPHHVAYAGLLRQFGLSAEQGHAIPEIGRAHVDTPYPNENIVCSLLIAKNNKKK